MVPSPISVDAPPMTAASPIGPESSVISRSSGVSFRVDAVQGGELLALAASRTVIGPVTASRSKACIGWPSSSIT